MGRGDKRTAKGKRFKHSFGNSRPKGVSKKKGRSKPATAAAPAAKATKKK